MDSGYDTIPPLPWSSERDDSHYIEIDATLKDWAGYIQAGEDFLSDLINA